MTDKPVDIHFRRDGEVQICLDMTYRPLSETERAYLFEVHRFQRWFVRTYGMLPQTNEISLPFLARYEQWMNVRFAPATVRRKRSAIRWFGGLLVILKLVAADPFGRCA